MKFTTHSATKNKESEIYNEGEKIKKGRFNYAGKNKKA